MKKEILLLIILTTIWLPVLILTNAQSQEQTIISYAQNIQASDVDSTLPKQPIEVWLLSLVGSEATISWEVNDCGEQTGLKRYSSSIDPPTCAQITSELTDGRMVGIQIIVGTYKKGITGKPEVFLIYVENQGEYKSTSKLGELQSLLGE
jgi:hypothetical protein